MRSSIYPLALLLLASCHSDCNQINNPVSKDYPCGTRAHACSMQPLMCCWNSEVCGTDSGNGCPKGMCCATGDFGINPDVPVSGTKQVGQWRP